MAGPRGRKLIRLAFDTSTAACTVALQLADGTIRESAISPSRMLEHPAHTTDLLPAISELMEAGGVAFDDLGAVAIGVGPGAFTGLRIGVSTARAIATARGIPLTAVSSLAALAVAADDSHDGPALPVIDARRGEYFFRATGEDQVGSPEALLAAAAALGAPLAVGDGAIKLADQLAAAGAIVPPLDDARHLVSAAAILGLAESIAASQVDDVVPNYIRAPDAKVSSRERWIGRMAKT